MRASTVILLAALAPAGAAMAQPPAGRRQATDFHLYSEVQSTAVLQPHAPYMIPLDVPATAAHREGGESRVFDAAGVEIPSVVHVAQHRTETVNRQFAIFNTAWEPGLVQTLSVDQGAGSHEAVNRFTFDIAELDYHVQVQVQGSEDAEQWRIIDDNLHLIRHSRPGERITYTHNTLRIPTSRFRYFRFVLASSGRNAPLTIRSVTARRSTETAAAMLELPIQPQRWRNPNDPDDRHEYWLLDLGHTHLGTSEVRLTIDGNNYARSATLWETADRDDVKLTRRIAHGIVHRYGNDRSDALGGFSTDRRRLVLMLDQGDNKPVRLLSVTARRPRLEVRFLAPPVAQWPVRLYMKPDEARAPEYDLPRLLAKRDVTAFTALPPGPVVTNPHYTKPAVPPPPVTERVPYLLYALVIPLVIGLGWYIARMIREGVPPESPSAES